MAKPLRPLQIGVHAFIRSRDKHGLSASDAQRRGGCIALSPHPARLQAFRRGTVIRLTTVQRMVLTFILDQAKQGKPTIIVSGHKKTRVGYFPALQAEGVATCTTSLFFLRHNGLIEPVGDDRYRLTATGERALGAASPSGVATTSKEWERRTRG